MLYNEFNRALLGANSTVETEGGLLIANSGAVQSWSPDGSPPAMYRIGRDFFDISQEPTWIPITVTRVIWGGMGNPEAVRRLILSDSGEED